jgi:hypothetical protein
MKMSGIGMLVSICRMLFARYVCIDFARVAGLALRDLLDQKRASFELVLSFLPTNSQL